MSPSSDLELIRDALILLHDKGGSIISRPDEHRRWKIKTQDYVGESISLLQACRSFIQDSKDMADGVLPGV